jgi:hypothetical protein
MLAIVAICLAGASKVLAVRAEAPEHACGGVSLLEEAEQEKFGMDVAMPVPNRGIMSVGQQPADSLAVTW